MHDTGGLGETAVVNFNAGQEVEALPGAKKGCGPAVNGEHFGPGSP